MPRPEAPALPSRDVLQLKAGGTASRLPRALALGVVYSLPLVSVPFLPFVRASAVAPAVILFAGALVMVTVVQRVRAVSISVVDASLMIGALAAIGISWIPVLLDLSAYSSSTSIVVVW